MSGAKPNGAATAVPDPPLATRCAKCLSKFGMFKHAHICAVCGSAVCSKCSSHTLFTTQSRACDGCFLRVQQQVAARAAFAEEEAARAATQIEGRLKNISERDLELHAVKNATVPPPAASLGNNEAAAATPIGKGDRSPFAHLPRTLRLAAEKAAAEGKPSPLEAAAGGGDGRGGGGDEAFGKGDRSPFAHLPLTLRLTAEREAAEGALPSVKTNDSAGGCGGGKRDGGAGERPRFDHLPLTLRLGAEQEWEAQQQQARHSNPTPSDNGADEKPDGAGAGAGAGAPAVGTSLDALARRMAALRPVRSAGPPPNANELAARLAKLTGRSAQAYISRPLSADDYEDEGELDEDELAERLLRQVTEESRLDGASDAAGISLVQPSRVADGGPGAPPPVPALDEFRDPSEREAQESDYSDVSDSADELPWCWLCSANARVRCTDCEGDLFCKSCFRKSHETLELKGHRWEEYAPPRRRRKNNR